MKMTKRYPRTIMATACVPWNEDFSFDEENFRRGVALLVDNGIRSIYTFGTAGEGYAVNREQFVAITKAFLDETGKTPDVMPMTGIISLSMSEIIERIELALDLGAKDFQLSFPSWGGVQPEEGMGFLKDICDRYPQARFMHYNNAFRSHTRLSMAHYTRLADEVPNLVAVKNTGLGIAQIQEFHSREIPIEFFNMEYAYGFASLTGSSSLLISYLNLNYKRAWDYFYAGQNRDVDKIVSMHSEIETAVRIMNDHIPAGKIDSAYDKLFSKFSIADFSQRLYPPYEGISDEHFNKFADALRRELPQWC